MNNSRLSTGRQSNPAAGLVSLMCVVLMAAARPQAQATDLEAQGVFEGSVSVTATQTARPTEEIAASVTLVGEEIIEQTAMSNLREALVGTPGTLIASKNQGYDARLIIRGSGLKARYAIREIMVLLDGVPITDPDSLTRLDFVDSHMIDRIEVVRGPNSTLWGCNATGGVVNVITRSPFASQGGSARVDLGTGGARRYHAAYGGPIGARHAYVLNLSRRESNNDWRLWNDFETTQLTVQPSFVLADNTLWENIISFTDAQIRLPGRIWCSHLCPVGALDAILARIGSRSGRRMRIDRTRCGGCGACADVCPTWAVETLGEPKINQLSCIPRRMCEEVCPTGAIRYARAQPSGTEPMV